MLFRSHLDVLAGIEVPDSVDLVIALTTSRQPVYDEAARAGRLVVGVGAFKPEMAEIGARTLAGSTIFVDDPAGARHEAGDLLQAKVDWSQVRGLVAALDAASGAATPVADDSAPRVFKTVGCAAWDLAAGRVARASLASAN